MFENILVVCTGNVCRSPVAAAMLQQRLPGKHVECAGIKAMVGENIDKTASELARIDSLSLNDHKGRQLTSDMIQGADLILVMTENQRLSIGEKYPAAMGKVMLYGQWLDNKEKGGLGREIPDPFRKSREAFTQVHKLLSEAADTWQKRLQG